MIQVTRLKVLLLDNHAGFVPFWLFIAQCCVILPIVFIKISVVRRHFACYKCRIFRDSSLFSVLMWWQWDWKITRSVESVRMWEESVFSVWRPCCSCACEDWEQTLPMSHSKIRQDALRLPSVTTVGRFFIMVGGEMIWKPWIVIPSREYAAIGVKYASNKWKQFDDGI